MAEFDSAGTMLKRYLHGPGVDEPLAWFDGSGTAAANRHDMFANPQGSIIAITNGSGVTETINRYDEFGIPQPGNVGRFGFTGHAWIPELGLSYYKARMYSPSLGRFMQTDPIGYDDGPNWYDYVGGDPVNRTDPSGLDATLVVTGTRIPNSPPRSPPPSPVPTINPCSVGACSSNSAATAFSTRPARKCYVGQSCARGSSPDTDEEESESGALALGVGLDLFVGVGFGVEGGLLFSENGIDPYASFIAGFGLDVSLGLVGTLYSDSKSVAGAFDAWSAGLGPINPGETYDRSGRRTGVAGGLSVGPIPFPISLKFVSGYTWTTYRSNTFYPNTLRTTSGFAERFSAPEGRWVQIK